MPRNSSARPIPLQSKPSTIHLSFDKKAMPAGFHDLSMGDNIMVMIRGKVTTLSEYDNEYERGGSLGVEYTQMELVGDAKPKTMQDALEAVGRKA